MTLIMIQIVFKFDENKIIYISTIMSLSNRKRGQRPNESQKDVILPQPVKVSIFQNNVQP